MKDKKGLYFAPEKAIVNNFLQHSALSGTSTLLCTNTKTYTNTSKSILNIQVGGGLKCNLFVYVYIIHYAIMKDLHEPRPTLESIICSLYFHAKETP